MSPINDGGFAFPMPDVLHVNGMVQHGFNGMTLREYYAGQALAGLIADQSRDGSADDRARYAYAYADAMLKAREVKP
jgi:hypothetical protein